MLLINTFTSSLSFTLELLASRADIAGPRQAVIPVLGFQNDATEIEMLDSCNIMFSALCHGRNAYTIITPHFENTATYPDGKAHER